MVTKTELSLPRGLGGDLEEIAFNHAPYDYLTIFSRVGNKVLSINDEVIAPFNLVEGESSNLGLFANRSLWKESLKGEDEIYLETRRNNHFRSAILGRFLFCDKQGRAYRDVDLKGIGELWQDGVNDPGRVRSDGGRQGLLDMESAFQEYQMNEELLRLGIRTSRTIAIIALEEVVYGNKILPVGQAFRGLAMEDFQPVIAVRAFGTRARIEDPFRSRMGMGPEAIVDAMKMVEDEIGTEIGDKEYMEWFGKTLGENVAVLHNNGLVHGYLTPHNITLDCRIVDLDTVHPSRDRWDIDGDYQGAVDTMFWMGENIINPFFPEPEEILVGSFEKSYEEIRSSE